MTEEGFMTAQRGGFRRIFVILGVSAMIFMAGCAGNKKKDEEGGVPSAPAADENTALGDSDTGKAMGLQTVHFPYDSFLLDEEGKGILKSNSDILKDKTALKIQVEGHCDNRGGIQYNIALGEKRANATRKFLQDLGVSGERITTISMGKEHPIDPGTSEEAYAKNRRGNFVITSH
jgi:peptidoglycan-associated lipoprotein